MIVLGVVLVVLAVAVVFAAVLGGTDTSASLDLGVLQVDSNALGVFLLGCATVLVLVAGLELIRTGARRSWRRRQELREARAVVAERERQGQAEREQAEREQAEGGQAEGEHAAREPGEQGSGDPSANPAAADLTGEATTARSDTKSASAARTDATVDRASSGIASPGDLSTPSGGGKHREPVQPSPDGPRESTR
jgi:hypothetical protein